MDAEAKMLNLPSEDFIIKDESKGINFLCSFVYCEFFLMVCLA